jgi:cyclohexyl-isocyanide hydratase
MSLKSAVLRPLSVYTRIGNAEFQRSRKIFPGSSSSRYTMSVIPESTRHLYIGSLIFAKLDQMDFTGPFEIFSRIPNSTYHIIGKETKPLRDTRGLILVPVKTFSEVPTLDLLHIPGGSGQEGLMDDEETLSFVREQAVEARGVFAVCTDALVLGAAGLLKGRKVTTHWAAFDLLIYFGGVPVNERVVIDGNLVTTAGVSAGIDGALRVAALLRGSQTAQEIQLGIQYAPEPPFNSGTPESAPPEVLAAVRSRLEKVSDARLATARRTGARLGIAEPDS